MQNANRAASALGERVKARLAELGMSQADLARRSGLSTGYVCNLVNGQRGKRISVETAQKLAGALRVRPSYLFGDRSQMRSERAKVQS